VTQAQRPRRAELSSASRLFGGRGIEAARPRHVSEETAEPAAEAPVAVMGEELIVDPAGALWWPRERVLAVADLHLEKGSAFAVRGQLLPPYDSADTLARLGRLVERYDPRLVIALGDSFHDSRAGERIDAGDRASLAGLQRGRDWVWIAGNHDPAPPRGVAGQWLEELLIGSLIFRHQPTGAEGEIAGHLHPAARVRGRSGSVRRRCLASDGTSAILPAFGAYAGGLNICDRAFRGLFSAERLTAFVLGRERVFAVAGARLLPD